jgi:hypothetical protein
VDDTVVARIQAWQRWRTAVDRGFSPWKLINPPCVTCGATATHRFPDGSPRFIDHPAHPPLIAAEAEDNQ